MTKKNIKEYNVCVIGGGPAGLMAAAIASMHGAKAILIEKNDRLGKKLLITGKGRCNITNAETDPRKFCEAFGNKGKFLYSAMFEFGVTDIIQFFETRGLKTKVERGNRVFPISDKAQSVLDVLVEALNNVTILNNTSLTEINANNNQIENIQVKQINSQHTITADTYIIATGGKSYPSTGSNGAGFLLLNKIGHKICPLSPALVPLIVEEPWVKDLQGLALKNAKYSLIQENRKKTKKFGEALFTRNGLSGPAILDLSKDANKLLNLGKTFLSIDLKPALVHKLLDSRLQRDFKEFQNKQFKNSLNNLLPQTLIPVIISLSGIQPDTPCHSITKKERHVLLALLKDLRFKIVGIGDFEKAIITSGGIDLKQIDPRSMRSKRYSNLFLAGEILNLDGPTGGYNLQVCWSTGYLAGKSAASSQNIDNGDVAK